MSKALHFMQQEQYDEEGFDPEEALYFLRQFEIYGRAEQEAAKQEAELDDLRAAADHKRKEYKESMK